MNAALPTTGHEIEELLSRPTPGAIEALAQSQGDFVILGVGGKMGPTLAQMVRRGLNAVGRKTTRVFGVARFSSNAIEADLRSLGIETVRCDLLNRTEVNNLPDAPNVLFLAGHKFGATSEPDFTWAMNTLVPAHVAERYIHSRIVAFSTGCVYPFVPITSGGSREEDAIGPVGDYANSCVGRERIFTYFSRMNLTPISIFRLNYAIDLRYGVLLDIAQKAWRGEPIDVTTGYVNVIWQGDANAQAIQCLMHTATPPFIINVTGPETISIRQLATRFGELLNKEAIISGTEAPTAWLSNSSKAQQLFGPPAISLQQMVEWTAQWVQRGGETLDKPTHFETRDGQF